ncbi:MAG: DUF692 domain-containing protein [Proteobacteria bacterium]|nr:DUF692 domain-containing protein [Pseudomonadota bacterium]
MDGYTSYSVAADRPLRAGIGLRAQHQEELLQKRPAVGWIEAHSENYFAAGGVQRQYLEQLRSIYPLSLHGVGLSLGSTDPLSRAHLQQLANLVRQFEPLLISEHLSWSSVDGRFTNDLLPLPYTEEALRHLVFRVCYVQEILGRRILIENVSSYLQFRHSTLAEWEFLTELADRSGCGILLDINNAYVSAQNHGFDPKVYLRSLPVAAVEEMHLAGHMARRIGERQLLIDTHNQRVCDAVWELYAFAVQLFGRVPTLIEWDADIPALEVLVAEASKADRIAEHKHVIAA